MIMRKTAITSFCLNCLFLHLLIQHFTDTTIFMNHYEKLEKCNLFQQIYNLISIAPKSQILCIRTFDYFRFDLNKTKQNRNSNINLKNWSKVDQHSVANILNCPYCNNQWLPWHTSTKMKHEAIPKRKSNHNHQNNIQHRDLESKLKLNSIQTDNLVWLLLILAFESCIVPIWLMLQYG